MTLTTESQRLAELRRQVTSENLSRDKHRLSSPGVGKPFTWRSVAIGAAKILAVVAFPFVLYVRTSVFLYAQAGTPWLAVSGGIALTLVVVTAYATWLVHGIFGKKDLASLARRVVAPIVAGWLVFSLVFLARVNAKTDDVRAWYSALHPVLRVAVSTAIIIDRDMVITDMQRVAVDYPRMGLPVNQRTRHYIQSDGWVHAVDLRTNGRSVLRNRALQLYFWSMGFSTTRHVGTADHLHVQLRSATP